MMTAALVLSGSALLIAIITGSYNPRVWLALTLLATVMALTASLVLLFGTDETWEYRGALVIGGEELHLRLDGLSAMFLALLSVVGGAGAVYAQEYWSDALQAHSAGAGRMWWSVLVLSLSLVLLMSNGLHFLLVWELFAVAAYFLVTLDRRSLEVRDAGWLYLGASHVATLCLFAFFSLLAAKTGSWDLGPMHDHPELAPLFWLALFAFGLKAGMFPLHVWLPSAHANAPSHVSAILSGVTLKIGIYGLMRFSGWIPVPASAGWVIATLGVVSAVLGVAFALGQHDLKRLLAYHSVENIGIILIGLGFAMVARDQGNALWGRLALAGALLHIWNHGLFKSLLFLAAGSVLHATGTRQMSQLGGLWRKMPWTTAFFALGAVAISGLPPLNGFVSEWLVYVGLFDATIARGPAAGAAMLAIALLGVTGAMALACFVKVCGVVFLGSARSEVAVEAHESGPAMLGAMVTLSVGCVAIGLAPITFWPAVSRGVEVWQPAWGGVAAPVPLAVLGLLHGALALLAVGGAIGLWLHSRRGGFRSSMTWDCGYAMPTSRMQYTAGSFAATLTEWFAWILRPVRDEDRPVAVFPTTASSERHTPETVLEYAVEPVGRAVLKLARMARRFQHGRVQTYLFYFLLAMAALTALVVLGGQVDASSNI